MKEKKPRVFRTQPPCWCLQTEARGHEAQPGPHRCSRADSSSTRNPQRLRVQTEGNHRKGANTHREAEFPRDIADASVITHGLSPRQFLTFHCHITYLLQHEANTWVPELSCLHARETNTAPRLPVLLKFLVSYGPRCGCHLINLLEAIAGAHRATGTVVPVYSHALLAA